MVNMSHIVKIQRERVIRDLLPDRCKIYPKFGDNPTISGSGVFSSDPPKAREWRHKTEIPCRADLSRAFRPDKLKVQATEIDEFNLEVPYDVVAEPTDLVHIQRPSDGKTEVFEIRKKKDMSAFDATQEWIVVTTGVVLDAWS